MWIFGYGSLMWKVDFPYEEKVPGFIKGYDRRFYQKSIKHRGTPERPGRVVTLIPSNPSAKVHGIAYHIDKNNEEDVISQLDVREFGYKRTQGLFYPTSGFNRTIPTIMYLADGIIHYSGPVDVKTIAAEVVASEGDSGPNTEYVCNLADSMRKIFPDIQDEHLFSVETEVLEMML